MPFDPIPHDGVDHAIAQANNALLYPGVGLGTVVSRRPRRTWHGWSWTIRSSRCRTRCGSRATSPRRLPADAVSS
ncbi:malic enzyme-like NAD(P)-binding protein [Nonomuraea insulae]|uniref:Malic enzyme-like NAD(P)-binding protein n=1 Tax=Nonomuraea insulae TaxID=1616787 RepID=A0ABW1CWE4_9ACTN